LAVKSGFDVLRLEIQARISHRQRQILRDSTLGGKRRAANIILTLTQRQPPSFFKSITVLEREFDVTLGFLTLIVDST
jgi:hypothetical protein